MTGALALARAGLFDFARSRVFFIILAAGVALVVVALSLQELAASQEGRILADFGLGGISLVSAALAAIVPLSSVAREIDARQIHLVLARPISRASYVAGRFLAVVGLVVLANLTLGAVLAGLLVATGAEGFAAGAFGAALFCSFEAFIVAAFAIFFGVRSSVAMSSLLLMLVFVLGRLTYSLDAVITAAFDGTAEEIALMAVRVLPALSRFDLTPLLHGSSAESGEIFRTAAYGMLYTIGVLAAASLRLSRRDLL
jgi:ABC-type transport system involved in multi-copper enzyme maturation permease subunit